MPFRRRSRKRAAFSFDSFGDGVEYRLYFASDTAINEPASNHLATKASSPRARRHRPNAASRNAAGPSPRPSSARAWLSSTARSSTSRCPLTEQISTPRSSMCNGWSKLTRCFWRRCFCWAARWAIIRPQKHLCHRRRPVCARFSLVRPGAEHPSIDRRARGAGNWRRAAGSRQSGDHQRLSRRRTRQGDRHLVGRYGITTALGPLLGGWLIEHVSWRAVFFLNVPIALGSHRAGLSLRSRKPRRRRFRQAGSLGAALATTQSRRDRLWPDRIVDAGLANSDRARRSRLAGSCCSRFLSSSKRACGTR